MIRITISQYKIAVFVGDQALISMSDEKLKFFLKFVLSSRCKWSNIFFITISPVLTIFWGSDLKENNWELDYEIWKIN